MPSKDHALRLTALRLGELGRDHDQAQVEHEERTDLTTAPPQTTATRLCSASYTSADKLLAAIARRHLPAGPTAANPPHAAAAVDRWDRRTDRRTDGWTPYRTALHPSGVA